MQDTTFEILPAYAPVFYRKEHQHFFVITGGRGSGKSLQICVLFIMKLLGDEYFKGVISRYSAKSVKSGIYAEIEKLIRDWKLTDIIKISGDQILNTQNGNSIITHSFRMADGTMTAKGKGIASPTALLIDEAQELPSEEEYIKMIGSFRTMGSERLFFLLLNPSSRNHWIFKRFYLPSGRPNEALWPDHVFIHTTYKDNPYLPQDYLDMIEQTRLNRPEEYNHHYLGQWRNAYEGTIFRNWKFESIDLASEEPIFGLDFGFASDPAACIEVRKHNGKIQVREVLYARGLTNDDIYRELISRGVGTGATIYADSAEPKSIEELKRLGLRGIKPAKKGPGSIQSGIKKISSLEVFCDPQSTNLITEYECYRWKQGSETPVDEFNHLMDALRYALTHWDKASGTYVFK